MLPLRSGRAEGAVRVLVIEDNHSTAEYVAKGLREAGHVVDLVQDGHDGLFQATKGDYDAIVCDRMLPGLNGLAIVKALRASGLRTPVLMLTALGEVEQRVEGLDAGADDYLAKPFSFSELRARLDALARRPAPAAGAGQGEATVLRVGDLEMDLLKRVVRRAGKAIELLGTEFRLLEFMMRRPGRVLTRTLILEHVWDMNFDPNTNVVDVHVSRLRRKIEAGHEGEPPLIRTVRGAGYAIGQGG
jgi:two-component system OmpR family response regulator